MKAYCEEKETVLPDETKERLLLTYIHKNRKLFSIITNPPPGWQPGGGNLSVFAAESEGFPGNIDFLALDDFRTSLFVLVLTQIAIFVLHDVIAGHIGHQHKVARLIPVALIILNFIQAIDLVQTAHLVIMSVGCFGINNTYHPSVCRISSNLSAMILILK